jgi:hypothetical protein
MGELMLCGWDLCQGAWSSNLDSLQDCSLIIPHNLGVSTLTFVGKMKRISETAGLITTSGANERTSDYYILIVFLSYLIIPLFLWIWHWNFSPFLRKRGPAVPPDSITVRQAVETGCSLKIRDKTGWVYEALRIVSDWLIDWFVVDKLYKLHKKGLCGVSDNKESGE